MPAALVVAMAWTVIAEGIVRRTGVTANVLWAPRSLARGVALLASFLPPAVLVARTRHGAASP